ncbi:unnamed protein product [Agarophyton chilense]
MPVGDAAQRACRICLTIIDAPLLPTQVAEQPRAATPPLTIMLSPFQALLEWDKSASHSLYRSYNARYPAYPLHWLELGAHGLPWLLIPLFLFLFVPTMSPISAALLVNLLGVTIIDLALIAVFKSLFRRHRPHYNRSIAPLSLHAVDQFSFPSGHATRAGLVTAFVLLAAAHKQLPPAWWCLYLFCPCVVIWALATAFSRVALGRHHVLDVIVGFLLGVLYVFMWAPCWVTPAVAETLRDELRVMLFGLGQVPSPVVGNAVRSTLSLTKRHMAFNLCRIQRHMSSNIHFSCALESS